MSKQELINKKNNEILKLKNEIRDICFEHIKESKNIKVGDLVKIPSKNKFAIFSDLHTETVNDSVIKTLVLTRLGVPSKKVTTFNINDVVKVDEKLETVIQNNFSGEDFDAKKAVESCIETQSQLQK